MLVRDIKPIDKKGVDLLKEKDKDAEEIIDRIVEIPFREPCKIFRKKGIKTLMSSANVNNILQEGEKPIEKEDVYGSGQQYLKLRPTYEEAGKGYAWIMIDFDSLSDENKDWLFRLQEKKGKDEEPIGEKTIWFVHPCEIGNLDHKIKIGEYDTNFLKKVLTEAEMPKGVKFDEKLAEFEKRHIVLAYHWGLYPLNTVILRKRITEHTTSEEVEQFFTSFAKAFKDQSIKQEITMNESEER